MGLDDLPQDIRYRVEYFDEESKRWAELGETMDDTHTKLVNGKRIPPFSDRIPQNLRSFGDAANRAFDAYVKTLGEGAKCAASLGSTLKASGSSYLRQENYGEDLVREIEQELEK